jgi:hypothetical protein
MIGPLIGVILYTLRGCDFVRAVSLWIADEVGMLCFVVSLTTNMVEIS